MKEKEFTGIRDWKQQDINEGAIVKTQQGTIFVVSWNEKQNQWCIIQSNKGGLPDLQGDWFVLEKYMQPNLELIGSVYGTPELMNDEEAKDPHEVSTVKCDLCNKEWVSVRPEGLSQLECHNCRNMVHFENIT